MKFKLRYLIFLGFLALLVSCSPKANYKVMSLFFDGVPNPDKSKELLVTDSIKKADTASVIAQTAKIAAPQFYMHPPYQKRECASCHDKSAMGKTIKPEPALCYTCHEDFNKKFKFIHGPVASGYCTNCHNPHMSKQKKLLLRTGQDICLDCHVQSEVLKNPVHKEIGDNPCTDCHNPHGGNDHFILN